MHLVILSLNLWLCVLLAAIQPERCKRHLLLSIQPREAANLGALVESLASSLPAYTVEVMDLSSMPFTQAVAVLRKADIFVFGTASEVAPLLIFRTQGTVAVELIPLRRANPIARNLAVMTSHVYLSWQQQASGGAADQLKDDAHSMGPGTVMQFDVPAIANVLRAAAMVVAGNVGDNFCAEDSVTPRQQQDCTWCSEGQKASVCVPP